MPLLTICGVYNLYPCIWSFLFTSRPFAKLQVFLLKPGGSTQEHFEKLVNLLEQFVYLHVDTIFLIVTVFFFFTQKVFKFWCLLL